MLGAFSLAIVLVFDSIAGSGSCFIRSAIACVFLCGLALYGLLNRLVVDITAGPNIYVSLVTIGPILFLGEYASYWWQRRLHEAPDKQKN